MSTRSSPGPTSPDPSSRTPIWRAARSRTSSTAPDAIKPSAPAARWPTDPEYPRQLLDDQELTDLVAYVEEIRSPRDRGGWAIGHFGPVSEGLVAWVVGLVAAVLTAGWLGTRRRDEIGTSGHH
jgi:hypothetical protein